jgi:hypothetical protein
MGNEQNDLIWGVANIGRAIGDLSHRKTKALLESHKLPANQIDGKWCASRSLLKQAVLGAAAASFGDKRR